MDTNTLVQTLQFTFSMCMRAPERESLFSDRYRPTPTHPRITPVFLAIVQPVHSSKPYHESLHSCLYPHQYLAQKKSFSTQCFSYFIPLSADLKSQRLEPYFSKSSFCSVPNVSESFVSDCENHYCCVSCLRSVHDVSTGQDWAHSASNLLRKETKKQKTKKSTRRRWTGVTEKEAGRSKYRWSSFTLVETSSYVSLVV